MPPSLMCVGIPESALNRIQKASVSTCPPALPRSVIRMLHQRELVDSHQRSRVTSEGQCSGSCTSMMLRRTSQYGSVASKPRWNISSFAMSCR